MRAMKSNQHDDRPRLRPSSRNGNRLPLRRPGERIGGRKKGTPNKMSPDLKEAIIAALDEAGDRIANGSIYPPLPSPGGRHEYFVWVALRKPRPFCRLLARLIPRKRAQHPDNPPLHVPDDDKPFESWEEYERACREAGILPITREGNTRGAFGMMPKSTRRRKSVPN
jgi:hypothetical protein